LHGIAPRRGTAGEERAGAWNSLFAGLVAVGFINGSTHRMLAAFDENPAGALLNGFGLSVIVWAALAVALALLSTAPAAPLGRRDWLVAGTALVLFTIPVGPLAWLGLMLVGAYLAATSAAGTRARRAGLIVLALIVPMFWSRVVFSLFGDALLRFDALLVSLAIGARRTGNALAFADGWGYYWIAPPCSSVANISLAVLTYILVSNLSDRRAKIPLFYAVLAVVSVVAINVGRMAITGISRAHYDLMHGPYGAAATSALSLAAMMGICLIGWRRSLAHATA
jgi:hypothetical protein